jgi:hypothetical protein
MLPLFIVMILCTIAGARPEPVVKGILDLLVSVVVGFFRLAGLVIAAIFLPRRRGSRTGQGSSNSDTTVPRRPRQPRRPHEDNQPSDSLLDQPRGTPWNL